MKKIENAWNRFIKLFMIIGMALVALLCLLITVDVLMRYIFRNPIKGSYELVQLVFSVIVFVSLIAAQNARMHIQIPMLVRMLPGSLKFIVGGLMSFLGTSTCAIIAIAMFKQATKGLTLLSHTDVLGIVYYPFYYAFAVLTVIFCIQMLLNTMRIIMAIKNEEYAIEILKSWN